MDWGTFWNGTTAIATVLATLVSTVVALVFRWFDKQQVAWVSFDATARWLDRETWVDGPRVETELANVGDGTALHVRVVGLGCHATMQGPQRLVSGHSERAVFEIRPAMRSGDEVHLDVWCDPADWDRAEVAIIWTPIPARFRGRRVWREPLRQVHAPPQHSRFAMTDAGYTSLVATAPQDMPSGPVLPEHRAPQRPLPPARWALASRWKLRRALRG